MYIHYINVYKQTLCQNSGTTQNKKFPEIISFCPWELQPQVRQIPSLLSQPPAQLGFWKPLPQIQSPAVLRGGAPSPNLLCCLNPAFVPRRPSCPPTGSMLPEACMADKSFQPLLSLTAEGKKNTQPPSLRSRKSNQQPNGCSNCGPSDQLGFNKTFYKRNSRCFKRLT